jgi:8-oxo-dGTP pyrophosphatase MutT (NUDIX family)
MHTPLVEVLEALAEFDPRRSDAFVPFTAGGALAGWMRKDFAAELEAWPEYFSVRARGAGMLEHFESPEHRTAAIAEVVESLAMQTVIGHWRGEQITVSEHFYAPPLFHLERAASHQFGVTLYGAHLNGVTVKRGEPYMWVAERSADKDTDPGRLDNLAAGRIPRAATPLGTMVKEANEEAGIDAALATAIKPVGAIRCRHETAEGLHNEIVFVHDLIVPETFEPLNRDGEVTAFHCLPLREVMDLIERNPHAFTLDAAYTILDFLIRRGYFTAAREDYLRLISLIRV